MSLVLAACAGAKPPAVQEPSKEQAPPPATAVACDASQATVSREADTRAAPWSIAQHLTKNFADGRISWLMPESKYQEYVVKPGAKNWGRCNDTGCYLFGAPASVIHEAVKQSMKDGRHDPAMIGKALGLPAANFEGPLRLMTFDIDDTAACVRLPVDADPGVWKCKSAEDTDCFKFGGYTSGGVPEIMVINAPVEKTNIEEVQ